jgi:glyoxylase-like metal-dependent hydrolase (beta-lactamase superfamily II)
MAADTGREAPDEGIEFYQKAGWEARELDQYKARFGDFGRMIHPLPDSYERLWRGRRLRIGKHIWEVLIGGGHSPEHASLYCEELDLFISGDQVLPRITSNVSVYPTEPSANPLQDWLLSIEDMRRRLPSDLLVLPSHNEPFIGIHVRLSQLEASALQGVERVREQLTNPRRVVDLVRALFRPTVATDSFQLGLATGETIARLNYLRNRNEVNVHFAPDGVAWHQTCESDAEPSARS